MYCLLNDITAEFEPNLDDDGSVQAPAMRTFYTYDALQKATLALKLMRAGIDLLYESWAEHTRCSPLTPTDAVASGLVRLMNGSRSLYATTMQLIYAEQTFFHGNSGAAPRTAHYDIITRCNPLLEYNIIVGGISDANVDDLAAAQEDELLFVAGFHVVGSKSGSNILSFNQSLLERTLLNEIHNGAGSALGEIERRLARMASLTDAPVRMGDFLSIWRRVVDHVHAFSPNPFGVEPGEDYRIGI